MRPDISPLDPAADHTVEAALSLLHAAGQVDIPDFPPVCPYDFRASLRQEPSYRRHERYLAREGDTVVGYLQLTLPLRDNRDNCEVELVVHPAHRRRGVGRALFEYAVGRLRDLGRKRLIGATVETLPGGPVRDHAGSAFAVAMGAKPALRDVRRRWDAATVDPAALSRMLADARAKAVGYQAVTWHGRTPEEYAADVAYLNGRLNSDAPLEDLTWEAERIDAARLRESEDNALARGRRIYGAGAVHEETGRMVAVTVLLGQRSTPWHAWQGITLVDPPHRGRRLGALVKLENLEFARTLQPELRAIDTWNAAVNQHMISINEEMGYRAVDGGVNWQREI